MFHSICEATMKLHNTSKSDMPGVVEAVLEEVEVVLVEAVLVETVLVEVVACWNTCKRTNFHQLC